MKADLQKQILSILSPIKRTGMDKLCTWLESSDFFTTPASTRFHLCETSGLAKHSWNVYSLFKEKNTRYKLQLSDESVALCGS
jgi:23S rRNA maturation-related 3'-5' exoribonuclease YhaM